MLPLRLIMAGTLALAASCASTDSPGGISPSTQIPGDVLAGSYVDTEGQSYDLRDVLSSGKPVALVFWQPWCGECIAEAPIVIAAQKRLGDEMAFFGVVSGPDEAVDEAHVAQTMLDTGMTYPTIRDRDLRLTDGVGVEYQPQIVIIDPSGTVAYKADAPPAEWH